MSVLRECEIFKEYISPSCEVYKVSLLTLCVSDPTEIVEEIDGEW